MIPSSYGGNYSPLTTNWINATGESNPTILNALNTFEDGLITNSFVSRLLAVYPLVGGNSTKHAFNFMNTSSFALTFFGGITHNANGYTPNGSTGYAKPGITPQTHLPLAENSFGFYSRTNGASNSYDISSRSGNNGMNLATKWNDNNTYYSSNDDVVAGAGNHLPNTLKLISVNRVAGVKKLFQNGVLMSSHTIATTSAVVPEIHISAQIQNGAINAYSTRNLSFVYFATASFSDSEMLTFSNLVQQLQTSLNRQV